MKKKPTVHEALRMLGVAPIKPGQIRGTRVDAIPEDGKEHFHVCPHCGQAVDRRDLGQVFYHEMPDHQPLPTK